MERIDEMLRNVVKAIEQRINEELTDTVQAIEELIEQTELNMTREIGENVDGIVDMHLAPVNDRLVELVTSTDSETIMGKVDVLGEKVDALSKKMDDNRHKLSQILEILKRINRSLDQE
jgi:hypothetical protein